jgi:hypothetical protein
MFPYGPSSRAREVEIEAPQLCTIRPRGGVLVTPKSHLFFIPIQ